MDGKLKALKEKLDRQLLEVAETAAALQALELGTAGPVHYSQIEGAAHAVGTRLSCQVQARAAREVVALAPVQSPCPECGKMCQLQTVKRKVKSIDGPVDLCESQGFCDRCRRSFFPSA